jgi:hypothetical protein
MGYKGLAARQRRSGICNTCDIPTGPGSAKRLPGLPWPRGSGASFALAGARPAPRLWPKLPRDSQSRRRSGVRRQRDPEEKGRKVLTASLAPADAGDVDFTHETGCQPRRGAEPRLSGTGGCRSLPVGRGRLQVPVCCSLPESGISITGKSVFRRTCGSQLPIWAI